MVGTHEFITNAIQFCIADSTGCKTQKDVIELLKTQDSLTHSKFRYSIAKDVTQFVFSNYGNIIKNTRLYGSTMEYTASKFSDIDMIIHVENSGMEIFNSLKKLDKILVSEYYNLIGEDVDQYTYLLDIHIVDEYMRNKIDPSKSYLLQILQNESVAI